MRDGGAGPAPRGCWRRVARPWRATRCGPARRAGRARPASRPWRVPPAGAIEAAVGQHDDGRGPLVGSRRSPRARRRDPIRARRARVEGARPGLRAPAAGQRAERRRAGPRRRRRACTRTSRRRWPSVGERLAEHAGAASRAGVDRPGRSIERDASTSTTTRRRPRVPRASTRDRPQHRREQRRAIAKRAAEPRRRAAAGAAAPRAAAELPEQQQQAEAPPSAQAERHAARAADRPTAPSCASRLLHRAAAHQRWGVHLVVLVVRAEHVHRDVDREPDGLLALRSPPGVTSKRLDAAGGARERAEQIVRREDDLRGAAADDRLELGAGPRRGRPRAGAGRTSGRSRSRGRSGSASPRGARARARAWRSARSSPCRARTRRRRARRRGPEKRRRPVDLAAGERLGRGLAAPDGEGLVEQRRIVGAHARWA